MTLANNYHNIARRTSNMPKKGTLAPKMGMEREKRLWNVSKCTLIGVSAYILTFLSMSGILISIKLVVN